MVLTIFAIAALVLLAGLGLSDRRTGHGASIWVYDPDTDELLGVVDNTEFEIEYSYKDEEATDSENTSVDGEAILPSVDSWSVTKIDKRSNPPESLGFVQGDRVNVYFQEGPDESYDEILGTLVLVKRITNPQTGLRKLVISGKYGDYTPSVEDI